MADHDWFKLEEARTKHRTARVLLAAAALTFASILVAESFKSIRYWSKPTEFNKNSSETKDEASPLGPKPFIIARPNGPDLEFEAGLKLEQSSDKNPDGTGAWTAQMTDYPPGEYRLQNAPNAAALYGLLQQSLGNFIEPKFQGLSKEIEIIGGADGLPVRDRFVYGGDLGVIKDVPYYSYDEQLHKNMTLAPGLTRMSNPSLFTDVKIKPTVPSPSARLSSG